MLEFIKMHSLDQQLLEIISRRSGQLSWYQIDRLISQSGVPPNGLMERLGELSQEGLIRQDITENPAQPVYSITDEGRAQLDKLKLGNLPDFGCQ